MKFRCAGDSNPGLVRTNNEDRVHCDAQRGIFLVVDGIGGQAAGEQAADLALNVVRARLERKIGTPEERLREAIAVANNEIVRAAATREEWRGMGCVLTAALIEDGVVTIGHVGDSRLYKIRNGTIQKLTHDHSPVGEREDNNEISELEAMRHPRRNEVFRDLGSSTHAPDDADFVEIARAPFEADSALLLCSDGLSDQVPSAGVREIVERNAGHPRRAVRELISAANGAGGKDNVTALVVEGERFADGAGPSLIAPAHLGRWALFAGIALAAGALAWFLRPASKPAVEPPRTLVVGAGGAFPTITAALSQARAGEIVEVLPGEYAEQIRLKDGVTLKSSRPRAAALQGIPGVQPAAAVVAENLKSGRIIGFRLLVRREAALATALLIMNSSIDVEDNDISAPVGIEIFGASRPLLRANDIHDCTYQGISVGPPAEPRIEHNAITGNGRGQLRPGIAVLSGSGPVLRGNTFGANGAGGVSVPDGFDLKAILESNFFLDGQTITRTPPGAAGGRPHR